MPHEPGLGLDAYERKFMDGERSLYCFRVTMAWWFHAILATVLVEVVWAASHTASLGPLVVIPPLLFLWIFTLFLRVTVTAAHVHIQFGTFGPKIPIDAIESAEVTAYSAVQHGGWGIRYAMDGSVAYSVPGVGGRGVQIRYRDASRVRTVFVSSARPELLLAVIERARTSAHLRIASTATDKAAAESEVAEEDEPSSNESVSSRAE